MPILHILLGASMAATPVPAASPVQAQPRPALWVVNDSDTVIYLFGTFHALDGKLSWYDRSVRTAFTASDQLILETLVPKLAGAPRRLSSGNLSPVKRAPASATVAELAPSSFLATTKQVMNAGRANGLSTDNGADAVLRDFADESGKPVAGLESFEFQLNMFSSLPTPPQPDVQDPRTAKALGDVLSQLQLAWSRGEMDTFAPMLRQMQAQSPVTYNKMFAERNARWAHWIADRMKQPGTVFVAVGAGHLSGPDSVQNKLATLGVKSARIN
jgi:hypothetical protein